MIYLSDQAGPGEPLAAQIARVLSELWRGKYGQRHDPNEIRVGRARADGAEAYPVIACANLPDGIIMLGPLGGQ